MSPRCHSWRRSARAHDPIHHPGECHRCWRPCHRAVSIGERCDECTAELLNAPEPWVRAALASEPSIDENVAEKLLDDGDLAVFVAAHQRGEERDDFEPVRIASPPLAINDLFSQEHEPEDDEFVVAERNDEW